MKVNFIFDNIGLNTQISSEFTVSATNEIITNTGSYKKSQRSYKRDIN